MYYNYFDNDIEDDGVTSEIIHLFEGDDVPSDSTPKTGDVLGVLPLKNMVLVPGVLLSVMITRPRSRKLVEDAFKKEQRIAVVCQKESKTEEPKSDDLYTLGTTARILRIFNMSDKSIGVILEGFERITVDEFITDKTAIKARIHIVPEIFPKRGDKEFLAIAANLKEQALKILSESDSVTQDATMTLRSIDNPPTLVNYICVNFGMRNAEKQELLGAESIKERAINLLSILNKEVQMIDMKKDIETKTRKDIDKDQREYFLHHQLETIQKELGDTGAQVANEYKERA